LDRENQRRSSGAGPRGGEAGKTGNPENAALCERVSPVLVTLLRSVLARVVFADPGFYVFPRPRGSADGVARLAALSLASGAASE
jgi:hypothetical protein